MITNINEFRKYMNESIRHGSFPGFSIDTKTYEITYFTANNDLEQDASIHADDGVLSLCTGEWSQGQCENYAEEMVEKLKSGKTADELLDEFFESGYY